MAAGDEELESLLRNFHRFSQGYKDALMEAQALRVDCNSESKKREALESHIADLNRDNERLRRLYTETLFKFTNKILSCIDGISLSSMLSFFTCEIELMEGL
ncbi:hypothetical protein BRADI_3g03824v3 [Brachypodium distachyon]|uniref:Uncharacterized protein n=1 Tax=Brachypodium distachyon TaxID=15368 RepID=A0A2K2CV08_BRADI|nr:hypothetical protein BRADI_3g03824v3 [Brachypodium distachyon]